MATNTMTLLNTVTVGVGGAASVTFSNIPQNYTDLVVKFSARTTGAWVDNNFVVEVNGSNAAYTGKGLYGTGSAAGSFGRSAATSIDIGYVDGASATANTFGNGEVYIPNYTSYNFKSMSSDSVAETNATAADSGLFAALWSSTAPITQLKLFDINAGTIAQYSEFTLYGVWNASDVSAPGTPLISGVADGGGGSALVTVSPSGSAAASYTVTSSPGGFTATSASNPVQVYGLSPATAYTFTAVGNNPLGSSTASASSASLTPYKGYVALATVTVGAGGAATVSFSSIDQNYSHLQLRMFGKDNRASYATNFYAQFNSDTSASYDDHSVSGDGASTSASFSGVSQTSVYIGRFTGATNSTNIFGASIVDILDYTNTSKYKTIRGLTGYDNNAANPGFVGLNSGLWQKTNAISSITIIPVGAAIQQYSTFTLYGVK